MKTLLKFSADYCNPCKQLSKILAEVNLQGISYQEINIEGNLDLVKQWSIRSVPTLILIDEEGKEVKRHMGSMSSTALKDFLESDALKEPWKETW